MLELPDLHACAIAMNDNVEIKSFIERIDVAKNAYLKQFTVFLSDPLGRFSTSFLR